MWILKHLKQKPRRTLSLLMIGILSFLFFIYTFLLQNVYSRQNGEKHGLFFGIYDSFAKEKLREEILKEKKQFPKNLVKANYSAQLDKKTTEEVPSYTTDLAEIDNDFSDVPYIITLKPNLSQMINSSRVISTIYTPYLLENKNICSEVQNLTVLVIIHTSVDHFVRRLSIRSTWTNNTFFLTLGTIRTLFLLGRTSDKKKQKKIEKEFNKYKDILQGDFVDSYHNLTFKGVMAYKWLTERCRNAKIILKTDDDVVVNMFKFFGNILPKYMNKSKQIICKYALSGKAPILRSNSSKWYISEDKFRGIRQYPATHCKGFMVMFTNDFIPALYRSAKVTPFFWVDDVYLYGLVPGNVPGVQFSRPTGKWHLLNSQKALKCYRNETSVCDYLVVGAKTHKAMEEEWFHIVKRYK